MPNYFFVTAAVVPGRTTNSAPCSTIDDALRGAIFTLGNGAESVWIVDGEGNLVLPPDQVRTRSNPPDSSTVASAVG
jgi:hypothetical protein